VVPETYRRLVQRLSAVLTALKGIAPFAQEPAQKTFLDELQKIVKPLNDSLESTQSDPKDMSAPIEESKSKLEDWLKKKPA
jgi:hypothetical protein